MNLLKCSVCGSYMVNTLYKCRNCQGNLVSLNYPVNRYISRELRFEVLNRQKWNCNICGCKLKYSKNQPWEAAIAHIDHIHPFTKRKSYPNGEDRINESINLQALCPDCNLSKSKKEIN